MGVTGTRGSLLLPCPPRRHPRSPRVTVTACDPGAKSLLLRPLPPLPPRLPPPSPAAPAVTGAHVAHVAHASRPHPPRPLPPRPLSPVAPVATGVPVARASRLPPLPLPLTPPHLPPRSTATSPSLNPRAGTRTVAREATAMATGDTRRSRPLGAQAPQAALPHPHSSPVARGTSPRRPVVTATEETGMATGMEATGSPSPHGSLLPSRHRATRRPTAATHAPDHLSSSAPSRRRR